MPGHTLERGTGNVKLLVIVVAEKWVNGLVLPAVSETFGRVLWFRQRLVA